MVREEPPWFVGVVATSQPTHVARMWHGRLVGCEMCLFILMRSLSDRPIAIIMQGHHFKGINALY